MHLLLENFILMSLSNIAMKNHKKKKTCFRVEGREVSWIVDSIINSFNVKMRREISTIVDLFNLIKQRDWEITRLFFFKSSNSSLSSSFRDDISRQTSQEVKKAHEIQSTNCTSLVASKVERLKTKFLTKTEATLSWFKRTRASFINEMNFAITKFNTTVDSLVLMIESIRRSALIN